MLLFEMPRLDPVLGLSLRRLVLGRLVLATALLARVCARAGSGPGQKRRRAPWVSGLVCLREDFLFAGEGDGEKDDDDNEDDEEEDDDEDEDAFANVTVLAGDRASGRGEGTEDGAADVGSAHVAHVGPSRASCTVFCACGD